MKFKTIAIVGGVSLVVGLLIHIKIQQSDPAFIAQQQEAQQQRAVAKAEADRLAAIAKAEADAKRATEQAERTAKRAAEQAEREAKQAAEQAAKAAEEERKAAEPLDKDTARYILVHNGIKCEETGITARKSVSALPNLIPIARGDSITISCANGQVYAVFKGQFEGKWTYWLTRFNRLTNTFDLI